MIPTFALPLILLLVSSACPQGAHADSLSSPKPAPRFAVVRTVGPMDDDVDALLKSFQLWDKDRFFPCDAANGGTLGYEVDLFISVSRETPRNVEMVQAVLDTFAEQGGWNGCFCHAAVVNVGLTEAEDRYSTKTQHSDPMWVNGPNQQFRSTFRHIQDAGYDAMFIMESDMYPLSEGWLTSILIEVAYQQPFGLLGSNYKGHAWDKFIEKMPRALVTHLNGNSVYNTTSPLFDQIVHEMELETHNLYKAVSYDYRISQIITEGMDGIPSVFPFPKLLDSVGVTDPNAPGAFPDKTAYFQQLFKKFPAEVKQGREGFVKISKFNSNFGADRLVDDIGETVIVHGRQYNPLNPPPADDRIARTSATNVLFKRFLETPNTTQTTTLIPSAPIVPVPAAAVPPVPLVDKLPNYKDVSEAFLDTDLPVFWHIPKAGGTSVLTFTERCLKLVTAVRAPAGHEKDQELQVIPVAGGYRLRLNVDVTTVEGITRANEMGFASSGLAQIIETPMVFPVNDILLRPELKGRLFTVMRHPVERAVSIFYYLRVATHEVTYQPEWKFWTIEDYAHSEMIEQNWMTRYLSNTPSGPLTDAHFQLAMKVLGEKFIIGLTTEMALSLKHFEKFFEWKAPTDCEVMNGGDVRSNVNKAKKDEPKEGDANWNLLAAMNNYDIPLYEYAVKLFEKQGELLGIPKPAVTTSTGR